MRLIDIDHFKVVAAGYIGKDLNKLIEKEPTIDPVRQGRWERIGDGTHLSCSSCGWSYLYFRAIDFYYCPFCGARMDEE